MREPGNFSYKTKTDTRPGCETTHGIREDPICVRSECPFQYTNREVSSQKGLISRIYKVVSHLKYNL